MDKNELERKLRILKAAANHTRIKILILLLTKNAPMSFTDLTKRFKLHHTTIADHLRILEQAGLVINERIKRPGYKAPFSFYKITREGREFLRFFRYWGGNFG